MKVGKLNYELLLMFPKTEFEFDDKSKYAMFHEDSGIVIYEIDKDLLWNHIRLTWVQYMVLHDELDCENVSITEKIWNKSMDMMIDEL